MSAKDRDHGRVRIMCTQAKESSTCANRRPYYLDGIEQAVVGGLRKKLRDRQAIEVYLRAYNAERKRLAADAVGARAKIEKRLAEAEREYDRAYQGYLKGFILEAEAERTLPHLRAELDRLRADLALSEDPQKVVALHPEAVKAYLAAIDRLEVTLAQHAADGDEEPRRALRDLVETVVVHPPDAEGVTIEIQGKLTALLGQNVFPSSKIRGGMVVAEARYIHSPPRVRIPFLFTTQVPARRRTACD